MRADNSRLMAAIDATAKIEDHIPDEIERTAIGMFEEESLAFCGVKWDWREASDGVRNRFRLWAFLKEYNNAR